MDAVATRFLGGLAGAVGGAQQRRDVLVVGGNRHDADAHAEPERTIVPEELVLADGHPQDFRGFHGFFQTAALEQHAKLVTAQPRQRVAPANFRFQQRAKLAEQRVAGAVATGIVDDLELIEIQVTQRVRGLAGLGALQCTLQAAFELAHG